MAAENLNRHMVRDMPDAVLQNVVRDVPDALVRDVRDMPEAVLNHEVRDVPDAVFNHVVRDMPEAVLNHVVRDVPDAVLDHVVRDVPDAVLQNVVRDVAAAVVRDVRDVPKAVLDNVVHDVPDAVLHNVFSDAPEAVCDNVVHAVPDAMLRNVVYDSLEAVLDNDFTLANDVVVADDSTSSSFIGDIIVSNDSLPLCAIKLPSKMCKRGRPKGADKTVVGLPKKRTAYSKLLPFNRLSVHDKEKAILSWLLSADIVNFALRGQLVDEDQIEVRPELLSPALVDENVELKLVQIFFTRDGWVSLNTAIKNLNKHITYFCCVCKIDIENSLSICCDCCLLWCHLICAGLNKAPKKKHWFCKQCTLKA